MDDNAELAEMYQDTMYSLRADKEHDFQKLSKIQTRFDQFKDKDYMKDLPESKYDLRDSEQEDDGASTEFSDFELNDMYKRYKLLHQEVDEEIMTLSERDKYFEQSRKNAFKKNNDPRKLGKWRA